MIRILVSLSLEVTVAVSAVAVEAAQGQTSPYSLATASSMTKVHRDPARNPSDFLASTAGQPIRLTGARGEYVHGQVIIVAGERNVPAVTWEAHPLQAPGGEKIPLTVRVVGYLKTEKPPSGATFAGWWPDPLLSHLTSFDVNAGMCQPLWVTASIPREAKPGDYEGAVEVQAGGSRQTVPVRLKVHGFELPKTRHLRVASTYEEGIGPMLHGEAWDETLKWKYRRFVLDHRLNVTGLYQYEMPMMLLTRNESVEDFRRLWEAGQNFFVVDLWEGASAWGAERFDAIDATLQRARDAGIPDEALWFYGYDEAQEDKRPAMIADAKVIKERYPRIGVMATAGIWHPSNHRFEDLGARDELGQLIDAWVPIFIYYEEADLGEGPHRSIEEAITAARERGQEVWWYFSCVPSHPYPNWFIEYPALEPRLLMGMMPWKHQPDGFLYYTLNRLNWDHPDKKNNQLLDDGPLCKWIPASQGTLNGDGCLFYFGINGPVSTIRLENLTDGLEDYEYFWVLRDLADQLWQSDLKRTGAGKRALQEARRCLEVPASTVESLKSYTDDPAEVERVRAAVAEAIESLLALGLEQR